MVFTLHNIGTEMIILVALYRVLFFIVGKSIINSIYSSRPWWDYLTTYEGLFSKNTQVEVVYVTLLCIHHFLGGLLMLYAYVVESPILFAHAALWELVDDINDLMCMVFLRWPFEELDVKMLVVMGFHHIFGVIIIVPVLTTGLYKDQNLQLIGIALLLAGAVSCLGLVISRTMDRRVPVEAWSDFLMWLVNLSFFSLCRFYVFPQQLYLFFEKNNWEANHVIIVAAVCMMIFNLLIFMDSLKSTYARGVIALNNGEKHDICESCHCERCIRMRPPPTAFMRFFKTFQIISPQECGAVGSMGAAKTKWAILEKVEKQRYIDEAEEEREIWDDEADLRESQLSESMKKRN